ncbi:MAG TPA: hypothetical protein VFH54_00800 [Mycobacteriales bacterium]|nr:hypothetical protein [Mycobacteriales bacterium]
MSAEVAVIREDVAELEQLDTAAREVAVTHALTDARNRLAFALQATGPETVAAIKAEVGAIADLSKRVGLSKEIRDDAIEMLRRAEYALGKAIRAGQEAGEIRKPGQSKTSYDRWNGTLRESKDSIKRSPADFASQTELSGQAGNDGIYAMADGVSEPEFERALVDARAEGNLSRANVVRKIKGIKADGLTPVEKLTKLRELAPSGMTAAAIATELGVTEEYVRTRAREHAIEITAEKVIGRTRRLDANRVIDSLVIEAASVVSPSLLAQVHFDDLDRNKLGEWISSLSESEKALRSLRRDLEKELHRV